ncbi:MAG: hypothetical protein J6X03_00310, partial [Bacilli bacterium]|nr:hypothetical protein [Bacilli bacterium]
GLSVLVVQTDSMEPVYPVNCTVFVQKVDPSEIKIGDDLTFFYTTLNYPMTHRCSEIITPADSGDGKYHFTVHGINTDSDQCEEASQGETRDCTYQTQPFPEDYLIGKVVGKSVVLGGVFYFLTQWYGLLTLLLIPTMYLVVTSVIDIAKAVKEPDEAAVIEGEIKENGGENSNSALKNMSEEDRKRLKEELLNQMLEEKGIKRNEED